jgi:hypothetical protein
MKKFFGDIFDRGLLVALAEAGTIFTQRVGPRIDSAIDTASLYYADHKLACLDTAAAVLFVVGVGLMTLGS